MSLYGDLAIWHSRWPLKKWGPKLDTFSIVLESALGGPLRAPAQSGQVTFEGGVSARFRAILQPRAHNLFAIRSLKRQHVPGSWLDQSDPGDRVS